MKKLLEPAKKRSTSVRANFARSASACTFLLYHVDQLTTSSLQSKVNCEEIVDTLLTNWEFCCDQFLSDLVRK